MGLAIMELIIKKPSIKQVIVMEFKFKESMIRWILIIKDWSKVSSIIVVGIGLDIGLLIYFT